MCVGESDRCCLIDACISHCMQHCMQHCTDFVVYFDCEIVGLDNQFVLRVFFHRSYHCQERMQSSQQSTISGPAGTRILQCSMLP